MNYDSSGQDEIVLPSNKFNLNVNNLRSSNDRHKNERVSLSASKKNEEIKVVYPSNTKKSIGLNNSPLKTINNNGDDYFNTILKQTAVKKQAQNNTFELNNFITKDSGLKQYSNINRKIDEINNLINASLKTHARQKQYNKPKYENNKKNNEKYFQYNNNNKEIFNASDKELYIQSIKKNLEHFTTKKQELQNNRVDLFASFDEKLEQLKRKTKHENETENKFNDMKVELNDHKAEYPNKPFDEKPSDNPKQTEAISEKKVESRPSTKIVNNDETKQGAKNHSSRTLNDDEENKPTVRYQSSSRLPAYHEQQEITGNLPKHETQAEQNKPEVEVRSKFSQRSNLPEYD